VRSPAERLAAPGSVVVGLVLLLTACGTSTTSEPPPARSASAVPSASATAQPTPGRRSQSAEPTGTGIALPTPGAPWDGATLLDEMRSSTRPGGVPDEVETMPIADAIADVIRTADGAAWDTMAIGGYCGTATCTIDIAGAHIGRAGEDLWTLEVDPAAASVEPLVAEVRSLPWDLVDTLDRLARTLDEDGSLGPMILSTARWLPPPAEPGRFVLSYRSGGEEGSCARELLLDAELGEIVEESATGC
jgi:hypothetical protein